ncbi:hypothetical protein [Leucobacter luti]|uniref:hypothetical protein n=1 Tax=Leucobacter luti TaxID=340320 RepID=UPI001FB61BAB|nr:hypothetical protein [Leucobacter luti]
MAGLYSWWHEPESGDDEGWHLTATILTRASAGDQLFMDAVSEASLPISERLREYAVRPLRGDGPELILPA